MIMTNKQFRAGSVQRVLYNFKKRLFIDELGKKNVFNWRQKSKKLGLNICLQNFWRLMVNLTSLKVT